jgi:cytochrome P450
VSTDAEPMAYPVPRTDPTAYPPEYARLRAQRPVCPVTLPTGDPAWLVTKHEDVKKVLADRRFSRAAMCAEDAPRLQAVRPSPYSILSMDPPKHTKVRQVAAQVFSPTRVRQMLPRMKQITDQLLDAMAALTPPVDLITHFARPLPLMVICEMLGLSYVDHAKFEEWTGHIMWLPSEAEAIIATYTEMRDYFARVIAEKRSNPGDDVLSDAARLTDEQGALTEAELISLGTFLLVAGYETSVTVLAESTLTLMRHPEQLALLRADPSLWPAAVEELLRLTNPGGSIFPRVATTDVTLSETTIPAGAAVVAHIGSGCRDESVVTDGDSFDLRRDIGFQIYFGHGPHFCLGAPLGRAEMEIGLQALFDRFPALRLGIGPEQLQWKHLGALGGFAEFPVTWK